LSADEEIAETDLLSAALRMTIREEAQGERVLPEAQPAR
jgi:hypothetical protein